MFSTYFNGLLAELYAILFLIFHGYIPLRWRYRNNLGEIDIIVKKGSVISFIEVKKRASLFNAAHCLTKQQILKINKSANMFLAKNQKYLNHQYRFDVVLVNKIFCISHVKNAWNI